MATRALLPRRRLLPGVAVTALLGLGLAWWIVDSQPPRLRAGNEDPILVPTVAGLESLRDILDSAPLTERLESLLRRQPIWRIYTDAREGADRVTHYFEFAPRVRRMSRVMQLAVDSSREDATAAFLPGEPEIRWRTMPLGRASALVPNPGVLAYLRAVLNDPETFDLLLLALRQDPPFAITDVYLPGAAPGGEANLQDAGEGAAGEAGQADSPVTIPGSVLAFFTFHHPSASDLAPLYVIETDSGESKLVIPDWLQRLR